MVDLQALQVQISDIGNQIREVKASEGGGDATKISELVAQLNTLKKEYADNNNGIGVDGKPWGGSKSEKKKDASTPVGGNAKQESDPNSVNAQKKAAKKAAKKATKQAHKENEGTAPAGEKPGNETVPGTTKPNPKVLVPDKAVSTSGSKQLSEVVTYTTPTTALNHLQLAINPNLPFNELPLAALSVAVLTDTAIDLDLTMDHRLRHCALGLENGGSVSGDFAMARYLARRVPTSTLLPSDPTQAAVVDAWIDYAQSLTFLPSPINAVTLTLEHALADRTYVAGHALTMADVCLFAAAGFPTETITDVLQALPTDSQHARRWFRMMASHPALQEATQLCIGITANAECAINADLEPLVAGMNTLEGAIEGRTCTRFPPEPSGYLHIGHAKAVLLNDYYARRYQGKLIVRFDDTNPTKEKQEYQDSIIEDLKRLGVQPTIFSFTSDYFNFIEVQARKLIRKGLAYMDNTPQEQMKLERGDRIESKNRNLTPEESEKYFDLMCSGSEEGASWCLRAKIDMKSDNGTLRDPVLYRQNLETHHRTGNKFKAFPTYDLACPIVDSIEGVTHALRTTEYNDRDEQYQWLLKAMGLRRVRIHAFSRVNFKYTVLSKRKLTWFVDNKKVTGWDDARMPTIRGIVRRGVNVSCLKNFMYSQGASRRVVLMDWMVFWSENKKELDKSAKRFMAIDEEQNIRLTITNGPSSADYSYVQTSFHPKDPSMGTRPVRIANQILLERVDVEGIQVGESIVLMRWGVVKITSVADEGLEGEFVPDGDFKATPRKLTWIADVAENAKVILMEFDNLISKEKLEEEENFLDFINPNTMASTFAVGDAGLKNLAESDIIQLERRGFFRVDRPYMSRDKPLILYMIPDGKAKAMSGLEGKLAHR